MEIIKMEQAVKTPHKSPLFTGSDVSMQKLLPGSAEFRINIVNFGPGVRNKLHYHSTEQVLIVTAGRGIIATEDKQWTVTAGDVIRIPAGVRHWHGAVEESGFSHIYVMRKDSELTQVED